MPATPFSSNPDPIPRGSLPAISGADMTTTTTTSAETDSAVAEDLEGLADQIVGELNSDVILGRP